MYIRYHPLSSFAELFTTDVRLFSSRTTERPQQICGNWRLSGYRSIFGDYFSQTSSASFFLSRPSILTHI